MRHTIALNNPWVSSAFVDEYHSEVATLASGVTVGKISDGDDENWAAIRVGIKSLYEFLRSPPNGFAFTPDGIRRGAQKKLIIAGNAIDASIFYSNNGTQSGITVVDGRHRIAALNILGAKEALIMVPASQTALFLSTFP
jgi:hypothetical protein